MYKYFHISGYMYNYTCFLSLECKVCPNISVISLYYRQSTATDDLRFAVLSKAKDIFKFESVIEKQVQVVSSTSNK